MLSIFGFPRLKWILNWVFQGPQSHRPKKSKTQTQKLCLVVHPTDRKWVISYNPSYKWTLPPLIPLKSPGL